MKQPKKLKLGEYDLLDDGNWMVYLGKDRYFTVSLQKDAEMLGYLAKIEQMLKRKK